MIARSIAKKVRISEISLGEWVKKEGMEPSFVRTKEGEEISRARILATIVSKFVADDGNYAAVTLDDGSDTIRAKTFKTAKLLGKTEIGQVYDVIGKIREYNGEVYLIPEIMKSVGDPNFEVLRRLELIYRDIGMKKAKDLVAKNKAKYMNPEELKRDLANNHGLRREWMEIFLGAEPTEGEKEMGSLKNEIMELIESDQEGVSFSYIIDKVKAKQADIEAVIDEFLADGICYEPVPGKIKKI